MVRGAGRLCLFGLAIGLCAEFANANVMGPGTYSLSNYPGGVSRSPFYGLRINELIDVTPGKLDVFTFDFDDPQSNMLLDFDGSTFHIHGTAFGGLNEGRGYTTDTAGLWNIDFTYGGVTTAAGETNLVVPVGQGPNSGTISFLGNPQNNQVARLLGPGPIALFDYAPATAYTFRLGDDTASDGRSVSQAGMVGSGWVTRSAGFTNATSFDWLFGVNPVPVPGAVFLALVGLVSAGAIRFGQGRRHAK